MDLLNVIFKILRINLSKKKDTKIFNVSSEVSTPINKIVSILKKKIKSNFRIKYIKISNHELGHTRGSNKELYKHIKFVPKKKISI